MVPGRVGLHPGLRVQGVGFRGRWYPRVVDHGDPRRACVCVYVCVRERESESPDPRRQPGGHEGAGCRVSG